MAAERCVRDFREITSETVANGEYFENKIKLGFTSTMSIIFMENLRISTKDARLILSHIASAEIDYLYEVEKQGEKGMVAALRRMGTPINIDGTLAANYKLCDKCKGVVGNYFLDQTRHDKKSKPTIMCSTCSTATHPTRQVPGRMHSKPRGAHKGGERTIDAKRSKTEQGSLLNAMLQRSASTSSNESMLDKDLRMAETNLGTAATAVLQRQRSPLKHKKKRRTGEDEYMSRSKKTTNDTTSSTRHQLKLTASEKQAQALGKRKRTTNSDSDCETTTDDESNN